MASAVHAIVPRCTVATGTSRLQFHGKPHRHQPHPKRWLPRWPMTGPRRHGTVEHFRILSTSVEVLKAERLRRTRAFGAVSAEPW